MRRLWRDAGRAEPDRRRARDGARFSSGLVRPIVEVLASFHVCAAAGLYEVVRVATGLQIATGQKCEGCAGHLHVPEVSAVERPCSAIVLQADPDARDPGVLRQCRVHGAVVVAESRHAAQVELYMDVDG